MKRIFLMLLFTVLGGTLVAQNISIEHPVEKTMNFGINVFVGGQFSNLNGLNALLKEEGIPEVNQRFMLLGGGINYIYENHFFRLKGNAAFN